MATAAEQHCLSPACAVLVRAAGTCMRQGKIMIHSTNDWIRFDNIVVSAGPLPIGNWLIATLRR